MYWQLSILKFEPVFALLPPPVLVTAIVAGGKSQVVTPPWVRVNFTGTTPRLELKTLVRSALIGG